MPVPAKPTSSSASFQSSAAVPQNAYARVLASVVEDALPIKEWSGGGNFTASPGADGAGVDAPVIVTGTLGPAVRFEATSQALVATGRAIANTTPTNTGPLTMWVLWKPDSTALCSVMSLGATTDPLGFWVDSQFRVYRAGVIRAPFTVMNVVPGHTQLLGFVQDSAASAATYFYYDFDDPNPAMVTSGGDADTMVMLDGSDPLLFSRAYGTGAGELSGAGVDLALWGPSDFATLVADPSFQVRTGATLGHGGLRRAGDFRPSFGSRNLKGR